MKKLIIMVSTFILACGSIAYSQNYTRNGKVFEQVKTNNKTANEHTRTDFTWKSTDGKVYPIYLSPKGRAYIIKVSKKTGKEYKQYLPKEISGEIKL